MRKFLALFLFTAMCVHAQGIGGKPGGIGGKPGGIGGGASPNVWSYIQIACGNMTSGCTGGTDGASNSSITAHLATSTTAGDQLVVEVLTYGTAAKTSVTPTESGGSPSTWVEDTGAEGGNANTGFVRIYHTLSDGGGNTSVTCAYSGTTVYLYCRVVQFRKSSAAVLDTLNATLYTGGTDCTSCAVPALSITSTDYILTFFNPDGTASGISNGSYNQPLNLQSGIGTAGALNISSYSAPNWNTSPSADAFVCVLAFK